MAPAVPAGCGLRAASHARACGLRSLGAALGLGHVVPHEAQDDEAKEVDEEGLAPAHGHQGGDREAPQGSTQADHRGLDADESAAGLAGVEVSDEAGGQRLEQSHAEAGEEADADDQGVGGVVNEEVGGQASDDDQGDADQDDAALTDRGGQSTGHEGCHQSGDGGKEMKPWMRVWETPGKWDCSSGSTGETAPTSEMMRAIDSRAILKMIEPVLGVALGAMTRP